MGESELSDSDKDANDEALANGKIRRSLKSMIKQMKMTDEEINYRLKNFNSEDVNKYVEHLKCTKCNLNFHHIINKGQNVGVHPLLGVLMCDSCCEYYGDGNFSLDSDGDDKYCRWCGEGGTIFVCSKCICGFCDKCIKKHFGNSVLENVKNDDDWVCYFCNPKPLWDLRCYCFLAEETSRDKREDLKKKKEKTVNVMSKKKRGMESKAGLADSSSDSCSSLTNSVQNKQPKRKRLSMRRNKGGTSSSEDEKENELTTEKKAKPQRRKQRGTEPRREKIGEEDSEGSAVKNPKKKLKTMRADSPDTLSVDDPEFEKKKARVLKKLETVWKFTETITSAGLSSCKNRLKKLTSGDDIKTMESLEKEHEHLKKFTVALLSSLNAAFNSVSAIREDLTVDSAGEEREIFQSRETELKRITREMEEDEEESEGLPLQLQGHSDRSPEVTTLEKEKPAPPGQSSEEQKRESDISGGNETLSLFKGSCSEKAKEYNEEKRESDAGKPLLKVKSFARMLEENILDGKLEETVENDVEKSGVGGLVNEYEVDTDENTEGENQKEGEKVTNKVEGEEENKKEEKKKEDEEKKEEDEEDEEEKEEDEEDEEKKEEDGEDSEVQEVMRLTRRKKKVQTGLKASFEKLKRKREKFLKSTKGSPERNEEKPVEPKASMVLEDSDSEEEKGERRKHGRMRKCILASSEDEDEKKGEGSAEKKSDSDSDSGEGKAPSSDSSSEESKNESKLKRNNKNKKESSDSGAKRSESDSEPSEPGPKKGSKWKRIRRKEEESSDSGSSEDRKKTKGRKNIKKILKKDSLQVETKEAIKNEEERKKRLKERRKLFEEIFPAEKNNELILDFDPETKEPLVSVHKKLVKKLKPHQREGVRFMWDSCFESMKKLEEDSGSGCILAHCMGLGKTLQVIALVHTLMTHDLGVNTVLIVCPLSTVSNWLREFETWLENINTDPITLYDLVKYKKKEERRFHLQDWHKFGGVLVLSYDLFRNLTKDLVKGKKLKRLSVYETALLDPGPDLVVCDEGHLLKNEDTALSKCMTRIKTSRRIVLTGTPLQNNLMEYHCMVQFVKPNILGTKKEFCNRFVNPISNGQFEDSTEMDVKIMKRRSHVLHSMLDGCVQRFDYSVLTPFLPEKHEYVLSIALTETQAKVYKHFINTLSAKSMGSSKAASLFNDFHNLQRIWTHPKTLLMQSDKEMQQKEDLDSEDSLKDFVVSSDEEESEPNSESSAEKAPPKRKRLLRSNANDPERKEAEEDDEVVEITNKHWWQDFYEEGACEDLRESNKLVILFSLLKHCEEVKDKVLVFSQSLYSLDLIEFFLSKVSENSRKDDEMLCGHQGSWVLGSDYFRLDGSTNSELRAMWCRHFNKPTNTRARLFLISTRAGGLGINLFGANRVVIFDASWNPSHDVQSIFRVYRFGQNKVCYIYRFLAEGTMEEKIYERQVTKLSLAHRVVDEHQIERHYSMMNLQELYNFEPTPMEKRKVPKLPKDNVLAELLTAHKDIIVGYHEHDSLLENREEEELTEEERKAAWKEYEDEKTQKTNPFNMEIYRQQLQMMMQQFPQFSENPGAGFLNPAFLSMQGNAGQSVVNMQPVNMQSTIPLTILQRGILVGLTPFFNESSESFFNRVIHREKWVQMSRGPREA